MSRIVRATIAILVPSIIFFGAICFVSVGTSAQRQRRRTPANPRAVTRPAAVDYSKFSHATKKHQGACVTCHKVPTDNWKKVKDFPDVADYPGHAACVSCHRPQFFKGAKPVICSVCHSKVSPRDDVRFAFRNPAAPRQFLIEFPHDKHQDVIARMFRHLPAKQRPLFVRASFTHSSMNADDKTKHYNNCEICHVPRTTASVAPASGWLDGYTPPVDTFKAVPDNHASCFNCHWTRQEPTRDKCAGCHKLTNAPYVPPASPERKSMKFRHEGGGEKRSHAVPPSECTVCHINITKAATLRGLKPDVPITSCTECHNKDGLRQDVSKELEAIDKNRDFVCRYCHTSDVGRLDPPASHYLIAGREAMKRKDVK